MTIIIISRGSGASGLGKVEGEFVEGEVLRLRGPALSVLLCGRCCCCCLAWLFFVVVVVVVVVWRGGCCLLLLWLLFVVDWCGCCCNNLLRDGGWLWACVVEIF